MTVWFACYLVTLVNCVLLPVLDVYCPNAAHQEFQFALVENLEQVELYQLVETLKESLHLVVNPERKIINRKKVILMAISLRSKSLCKTMFYADPRLYWPNYS